MFHAFKILLMHLHSQQLSSIEWFNFKNNEFQAYRKSKYKAKSGSDSNTIFHTKLIFIFLEKKKFFSKT